MPIVKQTYAWKARQRWVKLWDHFKWWELKASPSNQENIYPKTIGNFNSLDVRSGKVIAFEKKLFAGVFRQRVEAAIADIQTGGMTPFSILAPYTSCNFVLLGIHRNDLYPGTMK